MLKLEKVAELTSAARTVLMVDWYWVVGLYVIGEQPAYTKESRAEFEGFGTRIRMEIVRGRKNETGRGLACMFSILIEREK